jgi:hypothetical protein
MIRRKRFVGPRAASLRGGFETRPYTKRASRAILQPVATGRATKCALLPELIRISACVFPQSVIGDGLAIGRFPRPPGGSPGFSPLRIPVDVGGGAPVHVGSVRPVGQKATVHDEASVHVHCRQAPCEARRSFHTAWTLTGHEAAVSRRTEFME